MQPLGGLPDEDLVGLIADGDAGAFVVLYHRYARRMYAWAVARVGRERAEDAVQELFLKLWSRSKTFDESRGSFSNWFFAVARHHLIAEAQRLGAQRRLQVAAELEAIVSELASVSDPADEAALRDDAARLLAALGELPPEQRLAIGLAYFGGLTQSEIASRMGWPLGTVKKRIRLGMAKLRVAVERGGLRVVEDRHLDEEVGSTS